MENMITAGRQRRVLPWGKGGGKAWKILMEAGLYPSVTRGETFWLFLQQDATNRKHATVQHMAWESSLDI